MKQHINKIVLLAAIIVIPAISFGQYCNYFHTKYCLPSEDEMFKLNGQSKSALFAKGQTSELNIIVYNGQDYRISLCMDENLGSQIKFKIYETKKVKVEKVIETKTMEDEYKKCSDCDGSGSVDGENCYTCYGEGQVATGEQVEVINKETRIVIENRKELLFDNSTDGFVNEIEFSVESTRRLILEISVPGGSGESSAKSMKGKMMKSSDMGCVGVLVEHMTTPIAGFKGTGW
ncbi:MAG: hypothetical protein COX70_04750 [Flavobacteriales bacterium CG_4_10_14_0_2_um_filter_32_8]|nr:MAG: hypothetical protein COX70_04750 [Flavobacteriales bacterium CG_4_10_14_0_2_um_filter_32_8]